LVVSSGIFHIPIPEYPFCRGYSAGCLMKQYTTHSVSHSFRWRRSGFNKSFQETLNETVEKRCFLYTPISDDVY